MLLTIPYALQRGVYLPTRIVLLGLCSAHPPPSLLLPPPSSLLPPPSSLLPPPTSSTFLPPPPFPPPPFPPPPFPPPPPSSHLLPLATVQPTVTASLQPLPLVALVEDFSELALVAWEEGQWGIHGPIRLDQAHVRGGGWGTHERRGVGLT